MNKLLSIEAVREMLGGVARSTVYQLIADGDIDRVKIGRRALITNESVQQYVERLSGNT